MLRLIIFIILNFTSCHCHSQKVSKRHLKNSFESLKIKFINQDIYRDSRNLILDSIDGNYFNSDTLIFIEYFTDVTARYSCAVFTSQKSILECYEISSPNKQHKLKIHKSSLCGPSSVIVKAIQTNALEEMLAKGRYDQYTPNTTIIITTGLINNKEYSYKSYKTNYFMTKK